MTYLLYVVPQDDFSERVTREDCDAIEQAGIIDRTLLPVLQTGQGWADSRKSGYTVTGEIKSNAATFVLHDDSGPVAVLAVCLHSKTSAKLWQWIHSPNVSDSAPPQPAWAALRYDVPEASLPPWLDWWAKHVGFALMGREGW